MFVKGIWCDGLKDKASNSGKSVTGNKHSSACSSGRDKVDTIVLNSQVNVSRETLKKKGIIRYLVTWQNLKEKHGNKFTPMQYHVWCEMVHGALHDELDEPPASSMFKRAGKNDDSKKTEKKITMSEAFTYTAMVMSSALSPRATNQTMSSQVVVSQS